MTRPNCMTMLATVGGFAVVIGSLGGCANQNDKSSAMNPVGSLEAQRMAEHGEFERAKEPALTADTRYAAGQLLESQNNYPQAAEQYAQALKLNADHVPSLYRLGVLYAQFKKYDEAIKTWERYVKATRESAVGYSNLGFCYELAGQPDTAERIYLKGIERDSDNGPCRVNYGLMLARRGRTNEAILQLQSILSPAEVRYNLASVYEGLGRPEEAKVEYRKAVQLDPKMRDAQQRLAALE